MSAEALVQPTVEETEQVQLTTPDTDPNIPEGQETSEPDKSYDYEKGYKNLQPEFTRTTQALKTKEAEVEFWKSQALELKATLKPAPDKLIDEDFVPEDVRESLGEFEPEAAKLISGLYKELGTVKKAIRQTQAKTAQESFDESLDRLYRENPAVFAANANPEIQHRYVEEVNDLLGNYGGWNGAKERIASGAATPQEVAHISMVMKKATLLVAPATTPATTPATKPAPVSKTDDVVKKMVANAIPNAPASHNPPVVNEPKYGSREIALRIKRGLPV